MNKWSPERAEAIREFIDEYFMENRKSPTVRDVAAGTDISKTTVQRYLTDMKEHGGCVFNVEPLAEASQIPPALYF